MSNVLLAPAFPVSKAFSRTTQFRLSIRSEAVFTSNIKAVFASLPVEKPFRRPSRGKAVILTPSLWQFRRNPTRKSFGGKAVKFQALGTSEGRPRRGWAETPGTPSEIRHGYQAVDIGRIKSGVY